MALTFQFPVILFLAVLNSIVWQQHGPNKKKKLQDMWQVEASPANLLACNFKCIQRSSVCETWLCTLAVRRETCQARWRDGVLFDLSPHQPFLSRRTFMRGDVLKGRLKELFLKIISCLKISGASSQHVLKAPFKVSVNSDLLSAAAAAGRLLVSPTFQGRMRKWEGWALQMGLRGERRCDQVARTQRLTTLFISHS